MYNSPQKDTHLGALSLVSLTKSNITQNFYTSMNKNDLVTITRQAYLLLRQDAGERAAKGDEEAALDFIRYLAAENLVLKELGYTISEAGELIPYSKSELDTITALTLKAAKGNTDTSKEITRKSPVAKSGPPSTFQTDVTPEEHAEDLRKFVRTQKNQKPQ
jgi:hypothetical protein